jgi:hypothetical protein
VDCAGTADFATIGASDGTFTGQLLGYGHSISNLTTTGGGLIDKLQGTVRDLQLIDVAISGSDTQVGGLAAEANGGATVENCEVSGSVSGSDAHNVGGFIGYVNTGSGPDEPVTVVDVSFDGTISSGSGGGGVVGYWNNRPMVASGWTATGTIEAGSHAGGLGGHFRPAADSVLSDCSFSGDVTGVDNVGGVVGIASLTVRNCTSEGTVTGTEDVGGMVGTGATITECTSTSDVFGVQRVGGLAGSATIIERSHASGVVTGDFVVGGLVGYVYSGHVVDSYATGDVVGDEDRVGGLIGQTWDPYPSADVPSLIERSFSTGAVTGEEQVGGLIGYDQVGMEYIDGVLVYTYYPVVDSYWDTETSGWDTSTGGEGKTTAEMTTQTTFSGWDFTDVWTIDDGVSYPCLQWTGSACATPE